MLPKSDSYDVIVIGGGVAGLTAAAILAHYGARTVVYERHNVPGGCASFYQRDGYRFDVGATLVGGFGLRGVHRSLNAELDIDVSARAIEPSMVIHLPDDTVVRYGDERWAPERRRAFGEAAEPFWQRQERIAELAWDLSTRFPALPVDAFGVRTLARAVRPRHLPLVATLGRTVDAILPRGADRRLRTFIDAQLLITAQCDARRADLAYGCTALDLAREGTFHLADGTSTIATALARAIRRAGSRIAYGTAVASIATRRGRACGAAWTTERSLRPARSLRRFLPRTSYGCVRTSVRFTGRDSPLCRNAGARPRSSVVCRQASSRPGRRRTIKSSRRMTNRWAKVSRPSCPFPTKARRGAHAVADARSRSRLIPTWRAGSARTGTAARTPCAPNTDVFSVVRSSESCPARSRGRKSSSSPIRTPTNATRGASAASSAAPRKRRPSQRSAL